MACRGSKGRRMRQREIHGRVPGGLAGRPSRPAVAPAFPGRGDAAAPAERGRAELVRVRLSAVTSSVMDRGARR